MKSWVFTHITALAVLAVLMSTFGPSAQGQTLAQYTVTELPTLGGTVGAAESINDEGLVAGFANVVGDRTEHAILWINGTATDIGTLGGPNSSVGFPAKNNPGVLVGFSQTAGSDPLREGWNYFCGPSNSKPLCQGKSLITLGFIWQNGAMTPLPTLGGNISQAVGINNSGQVVGMAETATPDSTCVRPQVLDYEGVIWGINGSIASILPPFPGDHVAGSFGINDKGQVVGASGPCAPPTLGFPWHAVLWEDGHPVNLGSLGGILNNIAFAVNNAGQIVGISDLSGDNAAHAFLWQGGVMSDLGTLSGDAFSLAFSINSSGQAVGESCDASGNCRAFLWQNGSMTDLNALVTPGSHAHLLVANDINNEGQIVGQAYDDKTGETIGFVATPE